LHRVEAASRGAGVPGKLKEAAPYREREAMPPKLSQAMMLVQVGRAGHRPLRARSSRPENFAGDLEAYEQFWEEAMTLLFQPAQLLSVFLHPTQLLILEALARLEVPVSATVMEKISDEQITKGQYSYHLARLAELNLLEMVETKQRRGAREKFFDLRLVKTE
jgi:DNA-binding transcriptional ArsR family regulator